MSTTTSVPASWRKLPSGRRMAATRSADFAMCWLAAREGLARVGRSRLGPRAEGLPILRGRGRLIVFAGGEVAAESSDAEAETGRERHAVYGQEREGIVVGHEKSP
jgi:hypothetical protein